MRPGLVSSSATRVATSACSPTIASTYMPARCPVPATARSPTASREDFVPLSGTTSARESTGEPMSSRATVLLHPDFRVGEIDRRLFGSFVEHLGRAVYTGIYEPGHGTADEHGFRRDVADLTRELGVSMVGYPGGNFVSNHVWEDGVGPDRLPFIDLAWRTIEPNTVGTDEFLQWAERE